MGGGWASEVFFHLKTKGGGGGGGRNSFGSAIFHSFKKWQVQ